MESVWESIVEILIFALMKAGLLKEKEVFQFVELND